jgi:hypothetical protein
MEIPTYPKTSSQIAWARVATTFAVVSVGALAIGALAIGRLAIKGLIVQRGHVDKLSIKDLRIDRLTMKDQIPPNLEVVMSENVGRIVEDRN